MCRCRMVMELGCGGWVRFWEDKWVGLIAPKCSSPSLFRVANFPSMRIHECFERVDVEII